MSDQEKKTPEKQTDGQENQENQAGQNDQNDQGDQNQEDSKSKVDELALLKQRATMMNIPFSNNIGVETLRQKIQDALDGKSNTENTAPVEPAKANPLEAGAAQMAAATHEAEDGAQADQVEKPEKVLSLREKLRLENMRLVRCRITNLDPKKKDLPGEIVTVANDYIGTVRKFVPFGEHTEEGFHIEYCLYKMLKSRKFLNIRSTRDRRTGTQKVSQSWAPEFSIEVLPPLTKEELHKLAQAQIAAGSLDTEMAA